jgi:hypothetical protein
MNTKNMCAALSVQPFPYLHELDPADRDGFVLLDTYPRDCVEEWCASGGELSARFFVLLDDCAQTITRRFTLLDGEGQYYGWRSSGNLLGESYAASMEKRRIAKRSRRWILSLTGNTLSILGCVPKMVSKSYTQKIWCQISPLLGHRFLQMPQIYARVRC